MGLTENIKKEKILTQHIEFIQKDILLKRKLNQNKIELINYENLEEKKDILFKEYFITIFILKLEKILVCREFENKFVLYNSIGEEYKFIEK